MLPRWSLGIFEQFGYRTQQQTLETIEIQSRKIPVDAIILDLYWFGKTVQENRKFSLGQR